MGDTWVTDLTHFLREDGFIAPVAGPARKLAEHLGSIVALVTGKGTAVTQNMDLGTKDSGVICMISLTDKLWIETWRK